MRPHHSERRTQRGDRRVFDAATSAEGGEGGRENSEQLGVLVPFVTGEHILFKNELVRFQLHVQAPACCPLAFSQPVVQRETWNPASEAARSVGGRSARLRLTSTLKPDQYAQPQTI